MEKKQNISKLVLPNSHSFIGPACSFARELSKKFGFGEEEINSIELGFEEAITNIMEHAFGPDDEQSMDIEFLRDSLGLRILIKEKGRAFDPEEIATYVPGTKLEDIMEEGIGIFLLKKSMDEVTFRDLGKEGRETELVKYIQKKRIEHYMTERELHEFLGGLETTELFKDMGRTTPAREPRDFIIRYMKPPEAIQISRSIFETFGDTIGKEHIYYPERVMEMNESGLMTTAVATTESGTIAGHCSLLRIRDDDAIAEIMEAVVFPEYQGQGCYTQLVGNLREKARAMGLKGIFFRTIGYDARTQNILKKSGFRTCGLLLGNVPSHDEEAENSNDESKNAKKSYLLSFHYLNIPEKITIYPPKNHRDMIERIYNGLGVAPEIVEPDTTNLDFQGSFSRFWTRVVPSNDVATIEMHSYGEDCVQVIGQRMKSLCKQDIRVINLYLDLQDPLTCTVSHDFEKLGFFFAGILPGAVGNDALILQYHNDVTVDFGSIKGEPDIGSEILEHIR